MKCTETRSELQSGWSNNWRCTARTRISVLETMMDNPGGRLLAAAYGPVDSFTDMLEEGVIDGVIDGCKMFLLVTKIAYAME